MPLSRSSRPAAAAPVAPARLLTDRVALVSLDVVSALLTPGDGGEEGHPLLRKFAGFMWKRNRRAPHAWCRRWVEVTLEAFESQRVYRSSRVRVSRDADSPSGLIVALQRDAQGRVEGFRWASVVPEVEFEVAEEDDEPRERLSESSNRFFFRSSATVKKSVRLRAIPGTTPEALIAALAALGWPERAHKRGEGPDGSEPSGGLSRESRYAVQALLLGLGNARAACDLLACPASRQAMDDEAWAISTNGVRAVVAPLEETPDARLPDGTVVPYGVARGATFWVVDKNTPESNHRAPTAPSPRAMNERTSALIDRAVASRVIDDFAALRMRAQLTEGRSLDRLGDLLGRRLRDLRRQGSSTGEEGLNDDDDDDDDHESMLSDADDDGRSENINNNDNVDDNKSEPRATGVVAVADRVRVSHRGRWVEASVVSREELWLTVRFEDAGGDVFERRVRDDANYVRPSLSNGLRDLPLAPSDGAPTPMSSLPYSPRFRVVTTTEDDSDDSDEERQQRDPSGAPPSNHFAPSPRHSLLQTLSNFSLPLPQPTEPIDEEERDAEETITPPPPPSSSVVAKGNNRRDEGRNRQKTKNHQEEESFSGPLAAPPRGQRQQQGKKDDASAERKLRRFRRELSEHGTLTWDVDAFEQYVPGDAKRGLKTETCEAIVPKGARANSRLQVRVPGCEEPCIVVVPPEAGPGSRLRFRFFRVFNEDGSTSCVRWSGFPHNDLARAPAWRRSRLDQRLSQLRGSSSDENNSRSSSSAHQRGSRKEDIVVERCRFLESCLAALPTKKEKWRRPWRVHYAGERGADAGGVTREFWTDVSKGIWNPDLGLFKYAATDNLTYEISTFAQTLYAPEAAQRLHRTAGRLLAKALLDKQIISAALSRPMLKHILGQPVDFDDLQFVDASLHANLAWLLACENPEDVALLCQSFTVGEEAFGVVREVELLPGGRDLEVTFENRVRYVELRFKYAMMDRVAVPLSAFLRGFYDVVPLETIAGAPKSPELLDAQELELILFGMTVIDVDDWKAHTNYRNVSMHDRRCQYFWRVVQDDLDDHQRTRLLQFVTGTARVPAGGFKNLQGSAGVSCYFEICGIPGEDQAMPRSHTCFNRIDLPLYSSYEHMRHVLTNLISVDVQGFTEE